MTEPERPGCLARLKPILESLLIFSNFVLAGCTFYLAWTTSKQATATSDQVKASLKALEQQSQTTTQFHEGLVRFRQVVDIATENQKQLAILARSGGKVADIITTTSLQFPEVLEIRTDCKYKENPGLPHYRLLEPAKCDNIEVRLKNPGTTFRFYAKAIFNTQPETHCDSTPEEIKAKQDDWFVIPVGKCLNGALPPDIGFTVTGARNAT